MFAQVGANLAAVRSVASQFHWKKLIATSALLAAGGSVMSGCAAPVVSAGKGPADPHARVANVGYTSTVAPYARLRPTTPSLWRQRNDSVAPSSNSGH